MTKKGRHTFFGVNFEICWVPLEKSEISSLTTMPDRAMYHSSFLQTNPRRLNHLTSFNKSTNLTILYYSPDGKRRSWIVMIWRHVKSLLTIDRPTPFSLYRLSTRWVPMEFFGALRLIIKLWTEWNLVARSAVQPVFDWEPRARRSHLGRRVAPGREDSGGCGVVGGQGGAVRWGGLDVIPSPGGGGGVMADGSKGVEAADVCVLVLIVSGPVEEFLPFGS